MNTGKLKLEEVEVESFEIAEGEGEQGTVEANMLKSKAAGTCPGQTGYCTGCPPVHCY